MKLRERLTRFWYQPTIGAMQAEMLRKVRASWRIKGLPPGLKITRCGSGFTIYGTPTVSGNFRHSLEIVK